MPVVKKRNLIRMSPEQVAAGKAAWAASNPGAVPGSRIVGGRDFEREAQQTWIRWVNNRGEERKVIECELYLQPHSDGSAALIGMLHGMCPKCGEPFIVREDNKEMSLGALRYEHAHGTWLEPHYRVHLANKYGLKPGYDRSLLRGLIPNEALMRPPRADDEIPIVSGTNRVEEPWMCAYCQEWAVYVYEGIARDTEKAPGSFIASHERAGRPRPPGRPRDVLEV